MNKPLLLIVSAAASLLLTGCVVYMPMQCAAPQIMDKKQSEITVSTYLNGRMEASGTYSPVRHLLLRAAYSTLRDEPKRGSTGTDSSYYRGHQYDLGVGTYWRLGDQWLVGALGGVGQAQSMAAYSGRGFIYYAPRDEFDARYNKLFGEVYGSVKASETVSFGAAYRVTQVNFTRLTNRGVPVELSGMTRSEPMVFVRVRIGDGPSENRPIQLQAAWGTSGTFGYDERDTSISYPVGVRDLKQGRGYTTIGLTLFPHVLFRKAQPVVSAP